MSGGQTGSAAALFVTQDQSRGCEALLLDRRLALQGRQVSGESLDLVTSNRAQNGLSFLKIHACLLADVLPHAARRGLDLVQADSRNFSWPARPAVRPGLPRHVRAHPSRPRLRTSNSPAQRSGYPHMDWRFGCCRPVERSYRADWLSTLPTWPPATPWGRLCFCGRMGLATSVPSLEARQKIA